LGLFNHVREIFVFAAQFLKMRSYGHPCPPMTDVWTTSATQESVFVTKNRKH
jgi:hypothetical protein